MKITLIIPALNEEDHLPRLLKSIQKQNFKDYEIIVANSPKSTDKTGSIAKELGAKVVPGGLLSFARNNGAKYAKGDIFCFMDADTEFPDENYLDDCIALFEKEDLDIASTLVIPDEDSKRNISAYTAVHLWNILKRISNHLPKPFIEGGSMIFRRNVFEAINGFREDLPNGVPEDLDISLRGIKAGYKYKVIKAKILMSGRRYDKPLKAIQRLAAIATLGRLAMQTNLYKNER